MLQSRLQYSNSLYFHKNQRISMITVKHAVPSKYSKCQAILWFTYNYYKNLRDATHNADFPAALEALISPYIQLFCSSMWPGVRSCARSIKSWKISGGSLNRIWPEISDSALNRSWNHWFSMILRGLLNPIQMELRKKAPHMGPSKFQVRFENQH